VIASCSDRLAYLRNADTKLCNSALEGAVSTADRIAVEDHLTEAGRHLGAALSLVQHLDSVAELDAAARAAFEARMEALLRLAAEISQLVGSDLGVLKVIDLEAERRSERADPNQPG